MRLIFVLQAASTFMMTGIIWFVQIAHYPLFALAGENQFTLYAKTHATRTGWIVAPLMILELLTAALLCLARFRPVAVSASGALIGFALLAVIWGSTAWVQVPLHNTLARGLQQDIVQRLVRSNWVRTIAWTLRAALVLCWITIF